MYPLLTVPILKPKPWGGRRLAAYGKQLPADEAIGESWEVADLAEDVTGTPGGDRSVIGNGALAGGTLHDAMDDWGDALLGAAPPTPGGHFPLLVKLLDAREPLSVQVHPDGAYAAAHPGTFHKTESWYVVAADPGALLYLGLAGGVDAAALVTACESGDVAPVLRAVPARAGDLHHLPAGTVHALGAGVMVAEVQTPSDTTFRLYDWSHQLDRPARRLHVDEALEAIHWDESPLPPSRADGTATLLATEAYSIVQHAVAGEARLPPTPNACRIVMTVAGAAAVGGATLPSGTTAVVPAALATSGVVLTGDATVLEITPNAPSAAGK